MLVGIGNFTFKGSHAIALRLALVTLFCLFTFSSLSFASSNSGITYHGRILMPDGTPVTDSAVQFKMQILTPDSNSCLMYQEIQSKNLSASSGAFSITINDGTGVASFFGYTLDQIFGNYGTFALTPATCASGTGSYTPNSGDGRSFLVMFKTSSMSSWEQLPTQSINFAPFAIEAKQVAGFPGGTLLRVEDGTGPTAVRSITSTEANALLSLVDGTSTKYVQSTGNGAPLPALAANPSSPAAGDFWYDSSNNVLKFYNGSTVQTLGVSGGSVTSITAGTGLSGGTITSTGTIALSNVGTAGTYTKVTTDAQGRVTGGAQITGDDITSGTIAGSTAINSTGNITTTGNITSQNVSATAGSFRSIVLNDSVTPTPDTLTFKVPSTITSYQLVWPSAVASSSGQVLTSDTSGNLSWSSAATGTVTSVAMTVPSFLSVTGSPITSSGTLAVSLANQNANLVFAGPSSGGAAAPTFRSLAAADIPSLDWSKITSGTPTTLTGYGITDGVKNAGGSPSMAQGLDASLPSAGTAGRIYIATDTKKIYRDNGTTWDVISSATGSGGTVTSVTANSPISVATGTTTPVISIQQSDATHDGYLSATDWSTFNSKLGSLPTNVYVNGGNAFGAAATLGTTDSNTLAFKTNGTTAVTIDTSQRVGIGAAPSAALTLKAGTATAGTAPLKITAGVLTTTAEAGAIEYDGSSLYYTDSGGTRHALAASGSGLTALTGDVSASGSGSVAATVNKVNGVSYGASPSTNTVPVVTAANTVTYEQVPNAALANSSLTLGSTSVSLGATASSIAGLTSLSSNTVNAGVDGSTAGALVVYNTNSTAGVTIKNPSTVASGAYNFNLPASAGTAGQALLSGGGGATAMTWGTVGVAGGGTGLSSGTQGGIPYFATTTTMASSAALTQHAVVIGGGTSAPYSLSALGNSGSVLVSGGSSADPAFGTVNLASTNAVSGTLPVGNGGTGVATLTAHGVLIGEGTSAVTPVSSATTGTVLIGQGSSSDPAFSATPTLGVNGASGTTGQLAFANGVASGASTTIQPSASTTLAWTMTLPPDKGTSGYFLKTDGSGNTSWSAPTLPTLADDKIWVGQSGTATAVSMSGDATMTNAGVLSVTSTGASGFYKNGGNSFGSAATLGTNDSNSLSLKTNGSSRLTVDTAGNVGIGTTSPTSNLHVYNTSSNAADLYTTMENAASGKGSYFINKANSYYAGNEIITTGGTWIFGSMGNDNFVIHDHTNTTNVAEFQRGAPADSFYLKSSGNIGIGTTSPTAALHLKAGTAAAGTAPLKLTSGTLTTTAEAGAIEYDGSSLYYTDSGGARHALAASGSGISALTGDVSATGSGSVAATVNKVNGVTYGASPSTNTVPVVTAANTVTYEQVPNAALANSSLTLGSTSVSLGATASSLAGLTSVGLGVAGTTAGSLTIANTSAGGTVTIQNPSTTVAYNFNLPTSAGSSGQALLSGGGGATAMTWGSVGVAGGGTGLTSGNSGGIPYFSSSTTMASSAALTQYAVMIGGGSGAAPYALSSNGTAGNMLISGGSSANPTWGALNLAGGTNYVSGILPVANGGTGANTLTAHGVLVGEGTSAVTPVTAATTGTVLTGQGASSDPSFSATPTLGVNGVSGTTGSIALANGVASGASTTIQPSAATTTAWTLKLPSSGGTNLYFLQTDGNGNTTWALPTAALPSLADDKIWVGQSGTATAVTMSGDVAISNAGVMTVSKVNGVAYPSSPSTNTVPVVTAANTITYETLPNAALANSSITLGSTSVSLGATAPNIAGLTSLSSTTVTGTSTVAAGVDGSTAGSLILYNTNATAGVTIKNPSTAASGAYNFNLPATAGTAGQALLSGGGGSNPMTWGTIGVSGGGTGLSSGTQGGIPYFATTTTMASSAALTQYGVVVGGGTGAPTSTAAGAAGTLLTGQGSANPSFSATPTLGVNTSTTGSLALANGAASGAATTISPSASTTTAWTFTLPSSGGTSGYFLQTNGSGVTTWADPGTGSTGFYKNGGNSFGAAATLGTNDSNTLAFKTNGTTRMTIDTSGNVGIGTASPGSPLSFGSSPKEMLRLYDTGTATTSIGLGIASNDFQSFVGGSTNNFTWRQGGYGGTTLMTLLGTGNVGIGTATPTNLLHVNNSSGTLAGLRVDTVTATGANGGALVLNAPSGSNHLMFEAGGVQKAIQYISGNDMRFYVGGDRMTVTSTGNVGIGTTAPTAPLHIYGASAADVYETIGPATGAGTDGLNVGYGGGSYGAGVSFINAHSATAANAAMLFTVNGSEKMRVNNAGSVGIGTASPSASYALDVTGNIRATSGIYAVSFNYSSDRRLKENIETIENPIEKIMALRGVNFQWKATKEKDMGFIAQEIEPVLPEVMGRRPDATYGEIKTVKYANIVALTVEAIKEVWNRLTNHEERITQLEKENQELKARLDQLEQKLNQQTPSPQH